MDREEIEALEERHGKQGLDFLISWVIGQTGKQISPNSSTPTTLSNSTYAMLNTSDTKLNIEDSIGGNYPTLTCAVKTFGVVTLLSSIVIAIKSCSP